jgi:hypothetical protein
MNLFRPPLIEIRETGTPIGLGHFAVDGFLEGGVVELRPVVVFCALYDSIPESLQHRIFNSTALARKEAGDRAQMDRRSTGARLLFSSSHPSQGTHHATVVSSGAAQELRKEDDLETGPSEGDGLHDSMFSLTRQTRCGTPLWTHR